LFAEVYLLIFRAGRTPVRQRIEVPAERAGHHEKADYLIGGAADAYRCRCINERTCDKPAQ